ncbi:MAG: Npt1/Npt2 family nucleotide transporter [bacterium]
MVQSFFHKLSSLWNIKEEFRTKVFLQALAFLFIMACLVIWRPLKYSVFSKLVGSSFVPVAKLYSLLFIIPLILLYSKLVDWLRRHQVLYCFTLFHAVGGIIFYILFSHPTYGFANTQVDPNRLIGWAYFFFMESFNAFLSATFWSFADSINNAKDAKNYYGFIVSGSKIGGIISAGLLYIVLSFIPISSEAALIPNFFLVGSLLLFAATFAIYLLIKRVPENIMHGYEQVYQLEKASKNNGQKFSFLAMAKKPFDGLFIMLKNPYVLGIFSLVFCYEIITVILDYYLQLQVDKTSQSIGNMTSTYALYYLLMNSFGLIVTILGTTPILRLMGIRLSLFLFPAFCLATLIIVMLFPSTWILFAAGIGVRAINYAFNHPTREMLYIPTTKDIKFKAKAWTDAFGSRVAKSSGSFINLYMGTLISSMGICIGLTSLWIIVTYFVGKHLQHALDNNLVIGQKTKDSSPLAAQTDTTTQ